MIIIGRPLHGVPIPALLFPAVNCWATSVRPLCRLKLYFWAKPIGTVHAYIGAMRTGMGRLQVGPGPMAVLHEGLPNDSNLSRRHHGRDSSVDRG
jgi:hypothetical protein